MQPDRFTIKSQEALQAAQQLADERRNPQTTPEHLLAVLLEQEGGVVVPVLRKLGVDPATVRQSLSIALDALPKLSGAPGGGETAGGSGELVQILRAAETEMRELRDEYVSTEHVLLALAAHPGPAGEALRSAGAGRDTPPRNRAASPETRSLRIFRRPPAIGIGRAEWGNEANRITGAGGRFLSWRLEGPIGRALCDGCAAAARSGVMPLEVRLQGPRRWPRRFLGS